MPETEPVILRHVRLNAKEPVDIRIVEGRIAAIGPALDGDTLLDAQGAFAIPGLIDHHIHLLATAAQMESVALDGARDAKALAMLLSEAAQGRPEGVWIRATGYHERCAGPLDRHALDALCPRHPVRIQHQTGGLWIFNSMGLAALAPDTWPDAMERDAKGAPNGRLFRADGWLRAHLPPTPPDLAPLGARLARHGVTGVTDASVTNDCTSAALLSDAVRTRTLPARLMVMSGGALEAPAHSGFALGPVKILLDDDRLPPLDDVIARIADARRWGRSVAAHCVTAGELALMLAAFETAGSRPGDRIEHGSVIAAEAIPVIKALGLTVVTQSGFVDTRGDRYRALVDPAEQPDLYRCASLLAAGIPVAGSSDAPYGDVDPWRAMRAAVERRTADGYPLARNESVAATRALDLYLGAMDDPGGPPRTIAAGAPADLCLLRADIETTVCDRQRHPVVATVLGGTLTYCAG